MLAFFKRHRRLLSYQAVFIAIALLATLLSLRNGYWLNTGDGLFHYQRLIEIGTAIRHGSLPAFNLHTATIYGIATNMFYPWVIDVPIAVLMSFCRYHIMLLYLYLVVALLGGFESAYWASLSWHHDSRYSFMTACFYGISTYVFLIACVNQDLGELASGITLPFAYYGFLYWSRNGNWKMLACGMTLLAYTHVPAFVLMTVALFIWLLLDARGWSRIRLLNLAKAIGMTVLMTAVVWLPMLVIRMQNHIQLPARNIQPPINWLLFGTIYGTSLSVLIGLCTVTQWKQMPRTSKQAYLIGVLTMIVELPIAWIRPVYQFFISHAIGDLQIQSFDRTGMLTQLIFASLLSALLSGHLGKCRWYNHLMPKTLPYASLLLGVFLFIFAVPYRTTPQTKPWFPKRSYRATPYLDVASWKRIGERNYYRPRTHIVKPPSDTPAFNDRNQNSARYMNTVLDYSPLRNQMTTGKMSDRAFYVDGKSAGTAIPYCNGLRFHVKHRARTVTLPAVTYHGQRYRYYLDGKRIRIPGRQHAVRLHGLSAGTHRFTMQAPTMWYRWLALYASVIGIAWLAEISWSEHDSRGLEATIRKENHHENA